MENDSYRLLVRDQAGAEGLVRSTGALAEIEHAVVAHYEAHRPKAPYKPRLVQERLRNDHGWLLEQRVAPYDPQHDHLPINEKYDAWKTFAHEGKQVGIAIELDPWKIWEDLLKFRRGLNRGQIAAGVIILDSPYHLRYCYEHMRHVCEPLFGEMPVLYTAADGPGLRQPPTKPPPRYRTPYPMPS
jgi:hypothetical protein